MTESIRINRSDQLFTSRHLSSGKPSRSVVRRDGSWAASPSTTSVEPSRATSATMASISSVMRDSRRGTYSRTPFGVNRSLTSLRCSMCSGSSLAIMFASDGSPNERYAGRDVKSSSRRSTSSTSA